jgi:hypothetical protein
MFIIGVLFSVLGYTLVYYGVGMATQYSDTSGKAKPTAIPLAYLLGFKLWQRPGEATQYSRPPFKVGNRFANTATPATQNSPTPATGSQGTWT